MASEQSRVRYQRGQPRADVVTYRVLVDLKETDPPTWRRLEVACDLNLGEVHDILQVAFGWTDSHLHRFAAGPEFYSADAERYLCPFDEEAGDAEGVPEGFQATPFDINEINAAMKRLLRRIGAIVGERFGPRSEMPSAEGVLFARASLCTWPK